MVFIKIVLVLTLLHVIQNEVNLSLRDCSSIIGSTGPVFWGTGQGLFLMLPSTGHKDFLCFYGMGHGLFLGKNLSNYIL